MTLRIKNKLLCGAAVLPLASEPAAATSARTFTEDQQARRWSLTMPTLARWASRPLHYFRSTMDLYKFRFHVTWSPEDEVGHKAHYGTTGAGMSTRSLFQEENQSVFLKRAARA